MEPGTRKIDGREQRGDRTARLLVQAACRMFAQRGYAGASVRDIAGAAGVNAALVAYHFGSKEGLYLEVTEQAIRELRQRLDMAVEEEADLQGRARAAVKAAWCYLGSGEPSAQLLQKALLQADQRVVAMAKEHLGEMLALAPNASVSDRAEGAQALVSLFGAVVGPALYHELLDALLGAEWNADAGRRDRLQHLEALTDMLLNRLWVEGKASPSSAGLATNNRHDATSHGSGASG